MDTQRERETLAGRLIVRVTTAFATPLYCRTPAAAAERDEACGG